MNRIDRICKFDVLHGDKRAASRFDENIEIGRRI